ncbi:hypothetical protein DITRI_Ditri14bG0121400 [Diplodiscus trichospermus]
MKALFLIVCILLASTLYLPTFTVARELVEKEPTPTPGLTVCDRNTPYNRCVPRKEPPMPPKCPIYNRSCNKNIPSP